MNRERKLDIIKHFIDRAEGFTWDDSAEEDSSCIFTQGWVKVTGRCADPLYADPEDEERVGLYDFRNTPDKFPLFLRRAIEGVNKSDSWVKIIRGWDVDAWVPKYTIFDYNRHESLEYFVALDCNEDDIILKVLEWVMYGERAGVTF